MYSKYILFLFLGYLSVLPSFAGEFEVPDVNGNILYYNKISQRSVAVARHSTKQIPPRGHIVIPEQIEVDGHTYRVEQISRRAFASCDSLLSVVIPASVTTIDNFAFFDCTSLSSLTIFEGVSADSGLTSMGIGAFQRCLSLQSVFIPASVNHLGDGVFKDCPKITRMEVSPNNETYTSRDGYGEEMNGIIEQKNNSLWAGFGCTRIPSTLNRIGARAFLDCDRITEITIPEGVAFIDNSAFNGCRNLAKVSLPQSLKGIGKVVFSNCPRLQSINIPGGVQRLDVLFQNDSSLRQVKLAPGVRSIGDNAFFNCSALRQIVIPSSVTEIDGRAFMGCESLEFIRVDEDNSSFTSRNELGQELNGIFTKDGKTLVVGLSSTRWPSALRKVGSFSFAYNVNLQKLRLPMGVETIDDNAFLSCSHLSDIYLPSSLKSIGSHAFDNCTSLRTLSMPNGLEKIGSGAFYGCSGLTSFYLSGSVEKIESLSFAFCNHLDTVVVDKSNRYFTSFSRQGKPCNAIFNVKGDSLLFGFNTTFIPKGVRHLEDFAGRSFTQFRIPEGVESLGLDCFVQCLQLTSIVFPATLSHLPASAFEDCSRLRSIKVNLANPIFTSRQNGQEANHVWRRSSGQKLF